MVSQGQPAVISRCFSLGLTSYPRIVIRSVAELPNAPAASDCRIWVIGKTQKALSNAIHQLDLGCFNPNEHTMARLAGL